MFFFQSNEIVALKVLKYGGLCGGLALCGCLDSENVQGQCVICLPVWPDALASERNESQESIYIWVTIATERGGCKGGFGNL